MHINQRLLIMAHADAQNIIAINLYTLYTTVYYLHMHVVLI
jgi:hypothetical protein